MTEESRSPGGDRVPMTEEEIRASSIGEPSRWPGAQILVDYDPAWPRQYEREAARLRAVLGDLALRVEHTGSTSVPGLAAKPIIDMLLVLADPADEAAYLPALEAAGYVLRIREPHWYEHRVLKGPEADINLHVLPAGCPEIDRVLAFRDRLRGDAADRELYARTKRELTQRDWAFVQNYADAKTAVIEEILTRALPSGTGPRERREDGA